MSVVPSTWGAGIFSVVLTLSESGGSVMFGVVVKVNASSVTVSLKTALPPSVVQQNTKETNKNLLRILHVRFSKTNSFVATGTYDGVEVEFRFIMISDFCIGRTSIYLYQY